MLFPIMMGITVFMVVLTVMVHYEVLRLISDIIIPRISRWSIPPRQQMLVVIFGVFLAHTIEVWLYAFCYYFLEDYPQFGFFKGEVPGQLLDYMHFSVVTYTSVGFGDIYPVGHLRLLTGVEALTGLLMIGWSASFTYLSMERYWKLHDEYGHQRHKR